MAKLIHTLKLANHPITNIELSKKENKAAMNKLLSDCCIYAIAQAAYPMLEVVRDSDVLKIKMSNGSQSSSFIFLLMDFIEFLYPEFDSSNNKDLKLDIKVATDFGCYIVFSNVNYSEIKDFELNAWFLVTLRSEESRFFQGFDDYSKFLLFTVHYIGKATKGMYKRLISGHSARTRVISEVRPINSKNQITEEIVILPFKLSSFSFAEIGKSKSLSKNDEIDIVERALISALQPDFNGHLYIDMNKKIFKKLGFSSISLSISSDLKLNTKQAYLSGKYDTSGYSNSD